MRNLFATTLLESMQNDSKIWMLTGDLGFGVLDKIRQQYPDRSFNMGASEQLMLGTAVGLAHNNLIPICYSISPFIIFRPYEWIRNYLDHELAAVKLLGVGRNRDYGHLGFSHWAEDDSRALEVFKNIKIYKPKNEKEFISMWPEYIYNNKPSYMNISRS